VAQLRWLVVLLGICVLTQPHALSESARQTAAQDPLAQPSESFDQWLVRLKDEARQRGFSDELIDEALDDLQPLPHVIQSDRNQAELNPGFGRYLSTHLSNAVVIRGRELAMEEADLLRRLEATYHVPGRFLVAIWGMETRYGRITGRTPVFQALATLAWEPRRAEYFRGELFQALMMVDRGYIGVSSMTGSWAGAMGQTQFMPSSYMQYAVDFDGDGHRDIWKSTPDALASIANYLKGYGWEGDWTWGREVRITPEVRARISDLVPRRTEGCYARRNMTERIPLSIWGGLGVTNMDGTPVPALDAIAGLVDVGERTFLVYPNYDAILGYNCAHYYALTVALLADQFPGGSGTALALSAGKQVTPGRATASSKARSDRRKQPATKTARRAAPRRSR
jgi:membrane-bound lytic murein transglycosylase B